MAKARNGASKSGKTASQSGKNPSAPKPPRNSGLITATIDTATGKVVEVRSVDDTQLSVRRGEATLEDLFEQAFEAGIACVLGEDAGAGAKESKADVELRRQILRPMIEHSAARRLMRREVLGRAIVGTLIQQAAAAPSRPSPGA